MIALFKNLRLTAFFLSLIFCIAQSRAEITTDDRDYYIELDEQYGIDEIPWSLYFRFNHESFFGCFCFLKMPGYIYASMYDDEGNQKDFCYIVITFDSPSPCYELTLPCRFSYFHSQSQLDRIYSIDFTLSRGYLEPSGTDYKTAISNPIANEALNLCALEKYPIKSISINGYTLPGSYPSKETFKQIFDAGISKFSDSKYYDCIREQRRKASGNSEPNSDNKKALDPNGLPWLFPLGIEAIDKSDLTKINYFSDTMTGGLAFKYDSPYRDLGVININEIIRRPFGLSGFDWESTDMQLLWSLIDENIGFEGIYSYQTGNYLWTDIGLNADFELPGKIVKDGVTLVMRTNRNGLYSRAPEISLVVREGRISSIFEKFQFHIVDSSSDGDEIKFSEKELKKEVEKYYKQLIESLKKDGFDLKKEKGFKHRYSVEFPDRSCLTLSLNRKIINVEFVKHGLSTPIPRLIP